MEAQRAYSAFTVKALDTARRTFSGTATTPATDRMRDTVNPMGVRFKNPLTLLSGHKHDLSIGKAIFGKPTNKGIDFDAEIPVIEEPATLRERVETAWGEIRHELVRFVSIGFLPLKYSFKDDGGIDFEEIEIFELSIVSVPALPQAVITSIKSMHGGTLSRDVVDLIRAADCGPVKTVKLIPAPSAGGIKLIQP